MNIDGVSDTLGTPSLQIGGVGYNTAGRHLVYIVPSYSGGIRTIKLEQYGRDVSNAEITTWKIESLDDQGDPSSTPPVPAKTSYSRATFDVLKVNGHIADPTEIKGYTDFKTQTTLDGEGVDFRTLKNNYATQVVAIESNRRPSGIDSAFYGLTTFNCSVNFETSFDATGQNLQNPVVSFGTEQDGLTPLDAPITFQNVNKLRRDTTASNAGGMVFGTEDPAIRGFINPSSGNRTRCYNLDLTDPSVLLSTEERTDKICITRLFPASEYIFPNTGYNWNDSTQLYGFINLHTNFYVEVNTALTISPIFYNISIEWNVYVEEAIWGEYTSSTNGNADLYYKYVYTTDRDETSYSVVRNLGVGAVFWRSGSGNSSIDGTNTNRLSGGGYNMFFSDVRQIPEVERGFNIRIYVQASNDPLGNNEPAFIELRAGQGSTARADWIMKVSPINASLFRNIVG